jgi:hypothetical protein
MRIGADVELLSGRVSRVKLAQFVIVMQLLVPSGFLVAQADTTSCIADHYKVVALPLRPAHVNEARQVAAEPPVIARPCGPSNLGFASFLFPGASTIPKPLL